jgi:hypothetical protein
MVMLSLLRLLCDERAATNELRRTSTETDHAEAGTLVPPSRAFVWAVLPIPPAARLAYRQVMRRLIVLIAALSLTGCSLSYVEPPPSLSIDEATARYQGLFDEISTELERAYPGHIYTVDNALDSVDTTPCILWIGDLENTSTDAGDRDDYLAIIAPLLSDAGFVELRELDPPQGAPYEPAFVTHDDVGTRARVTFENPGFSFSIVANVTDDPCPT